MKKKILSAIAASTVGTALFAGSVTIYDENFSVFDGAIAVPAGVYSSFWGTLSGETFTPFTLGNLGYFDSATPELLVRFDKSDNVGLPAGTVLALSLTTLSEGSAWSSGANQVVLTDPSWLAPTFTLTTPNLDFVFTTQTTAIGGQYDFNGGNEIINLASTVIPEPSSFAAIAGLAVVGMAASRRRRSA